MRRPGRWVWALAAVPPATAVLTVQLAPDPHGHWVEHLATASLGVAQLVVLVVLVSRPGRPGLPIPEVVALGVVVVGIALQVAGGLQVADSIWGTSGDPGFGGGYAQGHDRTGTGDVLVVIGGLAFAATAGLTRRVAWPVALAGLVLAVVPPPWVLPATGVLVLLLLDARSAAGLSSRQESAPPG